MIPSVKAAINVGDCLVVSHIGTNVSKNPSMATSRRQFGHWIDKKFLKLILGYAEAEKNYTSKIFDSSKSNSSSN